MKTYEIDELAGIIKFEGKVYDLAKIKTLLKEKNVQLVEARTCPNHVSYTLSEEAKQLLRNLGEISKQQS